MSRRPGFAVAALALILIQGCAPQSTQVRPAPVIAVPSYDVLIKRGTIYDGSGGAPYVGNVGIRGDRIAYVGPAAPANATTVIEANGLAVTPGFINMLSWATVPRDWQSFQDQYLGRHCRQGNSFPLYGGNSFAGYKARKAIAQCAASLWSPVSSE